MKYEEACWTLGVWYCKSDEMSHGHLSFIFILVHSITHKKILQLAELQDFSLSFIRLGWRWRDLFLMLHISQYQIITNPKILLVTS